MRVRDDGWGDPDRDPGALVRAAVDAGVRVLDTAEMYGNEEVLGRAIAGVRDDVFLCTKFGVYWGTSGRFDDWSVRADPATVRTAIDGSLRRLGTDTIDLYYLHDRSDDTPIEDTVAAMAQLRKVGKIRFLGLSNVTAEDVRRAHAVHPISAVQQPWSLADRAVESMLPLLSELGIALVAHSPMNHGDLGETGGGVAVNRAAERAGISTAQLSLAWVQQRARSMEQQVVTLPGTTRVSHLRDNIAVGERELDDLSMAELA
ncbi:aldo/keto reductase [Epidermidibacterium keratini]|uniref:Aldo/keto reductase n=2 Tax=Epidermidibacterium keratini TaxID=1891644 RepID=A0A7L4YT61_9ACTN|nr:aldo/keto reductase [Epidermidibacterium keratini]